MRDSTIQRRRELYEEAMEIVQREYQHELSLDGLAWRLASSRRQLQRAFAEAGETTFRSSLQWVRMARAAELLQDRSLPVNRVATAVGYRQPAQFAKAFRRHHGRPPTDFRADANRLAA